MSYENSQSAPVQQARTNWAGALRHELSHRAEQYAVKHELPHCLSYGRSPTVCFECYGDSQHGNFLPATYKAILRNPNWRRRLRKVHSQGRKSLPRFDNGIRRELDACTSSDALLMNIFCSPGVFRNGQKYLRSSASSPMLSPISDSWRAYHCKTEDSTGQKWICA